MNPMSKQVYMFKVNFRAIIHQMRIESFSSKVMERLGPLPARILKLMMSSSMLHGKAHLINQSEAFTVEQIIGMFPSTSTNNLDMSKISSTLLDQMVADSLKPLKKVTSSISSSQAYAVDLASILYNLQLDFILSLIEKKYEDNKMMVRVIRALLALGVSNEKQLEDLCLLSAKAVRKILMELVKEGIVQMSEINAAKGQYAYSVKLTSYMPQLREKLLKSKLNLELKLQDQRLKLAALVRNKTASEEAVKSENFLLKKLTLGSYQVDNMLAHFLLF